MKTFYDVSAPSINRFVLVLFMPAQQTKRECSIKSFVHLHGQTFLSERRFVFAGLYLHVSSSCAWICRRCSLVRSAMPFVSIEINIYSVCLVRTHTHDFCFSCVSCVVVVVLQNFSFIS